MAGEGRDMVGPRGRQRASGEGVGRERPIFLPPPRDRSGVFPLNIPKISYIMGRREYLTKDVVIW